jgi:hypothetical protein
LNHESCMGAICLRRGMGGAKLVVICYFAGPTNHLDVSFIDF